MNAPNKKCSPLILVSLVFGVFGCAETGVDRLEEDVVVGLRVAGSGDDALAYQEVVFATGSVGLRNDEGDVVLAVDGYESGVAIHTPSGVVLLAGAGVVYAADSRDEDLLALGPITANDADGDRADDNEPEAFDRVRANAIGAAAVLARLVGDRTASADAKSAAARLAIDRLRAYSSLASTLARPRQAVLARELVSAQRLAQSLRARALSTPRACTYAHNQREHVSDPCEVTTINWTTIRLNDPNDLRRPVTQAEHHSWLYQCLGGAMIPLADPRAYPAESVAWLRSSCEERYGNPSWNPADPQP